MHIADFAVGMLGATAVVGAGLPIAVGAGLSAKLKKLIRLLRVSLGKELRIKELFTKASILRLLGICP